MATVSFDEKVVITDKDMIAQIKKDLSDPSPVNVKRTNFTYDKAQENVRQWVRAQSKK